MVEVSITFKVDSEQFVNRKAQNKKVLILSSTGGYGHTAATKTLTSILSKGYEFKIIHPINELKIWGISSGESVYNLLIANNWTRLTNWIARNFAPRIFRSRTKKTEDLITKHIEKEKPDLVISLIPYINYPASEAARLANIPFLLITTDNDLHNWIHGLSEVKHPHFKVTIGADLPTTKGILLHQKISLDAIEVTGLPLRPQFIQKKTKPELRKAYGIDPKHSVILLMMGGVAAKNTYIYAKKIAESCLSTHLIVCVGKNQNLASKLKKIVVDPSNALTIMPFTEAISELMTMSNLLITKPGPGTINEAIEMKIPLLIDNTREPLFWERANIDWITSLGIGRAIEDIEQVPSLLQNYFKEQGSLTPFQIAFEQVPQNQFSERIQLLVEKMCLLPFKNQSDEDFVKIK